MCQKERGIAIATELRTLGSKGVWELRPQPGVLPLHPVLTSVTTAISTVVSEHSRRSMLGEPIAEIKSVEQNVLIEVSTVARAIAVYSGCRLLGLVVHQQGVML